MFSRRAKTLATAASLATLTAAAAAFDYFPLIVAKETDDDRLKKKIVIIGGGTAGVGIAAQLINQGIYDVTVIEPKRVHYYQPLWTLVGAGMKKDYQSEYPMKQVLSKRAIWLN
jgi:NADPH-dependent 2,4-dienoyl-CoA reductase/sulfur reductase-like enzyme